MKTQDIIIHLRTLGRSEQRSAIASWPDGLATKVFTDFPDDGDDLGLLLRDRRKMDTPVPAS